MKVLPPMTIGIVDCDWFLRAMKDVLQETQRFPGTAWDTVAGLARGTMRA
jgi:hypothetical protein